MQASFSTYLPKRSTAILDYYFFFGQSPSRKLQASGKVVPFCVAHDPCEQLILAFWDGKPRQMIAFLRRMD